MLEPCDGKLSCTVLRGERGCKASDLPGFFKDIAMDNNTILQKIIYWSLCTIMIIVLFAIIVGGTLFLNEENFSISAVLGMLISALGSILVILAIFKPHVLIPKQTKRELNKTVKNEKFILVWPIIIGFSMLFGGLMYGITGNNNYLILCFLLPMLVSIVSKTFVKKKN